MRAYLHLCNDKKENSVMYQVLDEDYDLKEGETFLYTQNLFEKLDKEAKEIFEKSKLKIGNYRVESSWTEKNEYWGELRILHLRPE
jgi:hypothetical protein